jgi:hypothetical protein
MWKFGFSWQKYNIFSDSETSSEKQKTYKKIPVGFEKSTLRQA